MDLITSLPRSRSGWDAIVVFVCRLTKQFHAIPTLTSCSASDLAHIAMREVVRHHGLPTSIVSDRDPRFVAHFWRSLWKLLRTQLDMSTSYHPQSDGQTERDNRTLEEMLRAYVDSQQDDWDELLPLMEMAYNNAVQASTGFTPYYLNTGRHLATTLSQAMEHAKDCSTPAARVLLQRWEAALLQAKQNMQRAQERQKKNADRHRRELTFQPGDKVWLSTENLRAKGIGAAKLMQRYMGPYVVKRAVSTTAYELKLPASMCIHPVFHVHLLKPFIDGQQVLPERVPTHARPDPVVHEDGGEPEWLVERILDKRLFRNRQVQYLVKWKGYPMEEASWEPEAHVGRSQELLREFEERRQQQQQQQRALRSRRQ